jgi:hypothetical protein
VDTREMLHDTFQFTDDPIDVEDRVRHEVLQAFSAADDLHKECSQGQSGSGDEDIVQIGMEDHIGDSNTIDEGLHLNFDPQ